MIVADYSQIELRVAALMSQDRTMLEAYHKGEDLHRKTAASILGIAPEEVTKEQRQTAKAVYFGLLFGQGAEGLCVYAKATYGVNMTVDDAEKARSAFFRTYPQLKQWQKKNRWEGKTQECRLHQGRTNKRFQ